MTCLLDHLLVWLVFTPVIGALFSLPFSARLCRWVALLFSLIGVGLGALLFCQFQAVNSEHFQMSVLAPWIPIYHIQFALGVDGLSFPLVLLTKLMVPIAILASWNETRRPRAFMACYLLLDMAMTGTFLATDIFLFYVFWELMLIPMLLLIGVWGSTDRIYASLKFFLFTFVGSLLMLVSIFWVFSTYQAQYGFYSADIASFSTLSFPPGPLFWGLGAQELVFLGFAIAFLIKVPLFPLHTWLPDAHVQAPTGGSVLLAAVLLKMGTYGLLRFAIPIAPQGFLHFQGLLVALSLIGLLYGAWVAYCQTDFKKLVAYSSVSHLALVVLGICALNPEALTGSMLQMINHGLSTGALFLLVGMLYERRHSRNFADFGGLAEILPWYAFFLVFIACSSMGVPGLNGFIGEFLILVGSFRANPLWAAIASMGVIFGAAYTLLMVRKVLFGPVESAENRALKDMCARDWLAIVPLCVFILALGIYPGVLLDKFDASLQNYWTSVLPKKGAKLERSPSARPAHRLVIAGNKDQP